MKKFCRQCEQDVRVADYYRHPKSADGLLAICKACHRANVRANRQSKLDYYREADRARANLPHRVEARRQYQRTEAGRAAMSRSGKKYNRTPQGRETKRRFIERNPLKRAAHVAVGSAIRAGLLIRQPCEVCGHEKAQAHHDDYGKPLDVRWLCTTHHAEWHKHNKPAVPDQQGQVA